MSDLDFNILKILTTDSTKALDFAFNCDSDLFSQDSKEDASLVVDFIKSYRAIPSKRTFIDRYATSPEKLKHLSEFWDDIQNHDYNVSDYKYDLQEMRERFKKRYVKSIHHSVTEKMESGVDPDTIIIDIALRLQKASSVNAGRTHIQKSAGDYLDEFKKRYESKLNTEIENPVIMTGYSMLDAVTSGISPAELIVIGGETNAGKSMLLSNMSTQIWMQGNNIDTPPDEYKRGYNVLYFSLEMPYEDCFDRFLARVADIPQRSIRDATLNKDQVEKMHQGLDFIDKYQKAGNFFNIVDVPRNVTIEEIELRFQDAILQFRPDVVVVDYMGLMHDPAKAKEQDWLKMGAIAASLHEFSRAYNVAMITAVQLTDIKRGAKTKGEQDENQKVGVHRIGRSSHIMHHVNIGIQIETRMNEKNLPDMKYHVIKNRKGPLGVGHMIKNFEHASLYDVPFEDEKETEGNVLENIDELIKDLRNKNE